MYWKERDKNKIKEKDVPNLKFDFLCNFELQSQVWKVRLDSMKYTNHRTLSDFYFHSNSVNVAQCPDY